jgi:amino-acid N-acetyltransferase
MRSAISVEGQSETPASPLVRVRKAAMHDIPGLLGLINDYAAKGVMLARTEFEISENIRDFAVAVSGNRLAGCGALHFYSPTAGEVRSLAVDPAIKTQGVGRSIVNYLVEEAARYELGAVFAFTYVPGFFARVGFQEVERGLLPLKAWKDCLRCPKFEHCDEIAVLRILRQDRWLHDGVQQPETNSLVQLPTIKV